MQTQSSVCLRAHVCVRACAYVRALFIGTGSTADMNAGGYTKSHTQVCLAVIFFFKLFCEWSRLLINVGFCVLWPCWNDAFCTFVLLINMNDALKTDQQLARSELEL